MNNNNQEIDLYFRKRGESRTFGAFIYSDYCTFNLKGEFILYNSKSACHEYRKTIWLYSTKSNNNEWMCKRFHLLPEDFELISISKYDKVYLCSSDYIYEWDILTERSVKIFCNNEKNEENKVINVVKLFFKTNRE